MRYKGYVVSYVGENGKVNKENYYLNGFCKEDVDASFVHNRNEEFKSCNLYALSSAVNCDDMGEYLSYVAVDILRNFHMADFDNISNEFFHVANTAVTSEVLDRKTGHFEVNMAVLSLCNDVATVHNLGDVPVLYCENGKCTNLSGVAPERVELEKDYFDSHGEMQTKRMIKQTIPYMGRLDTDKEVIPYTSSAIKLKRKAYFVLCSKAVLDLVGTEQIVQILEDKKVKKKHKALAIIDKAVRLDPEGNYTVEVVSVNRGLAIASGELKSLSKWFVIAAICVGVCANSDFFVYHISNFVNGIKSLIQEYTAEDEVNPASDLRWIPKDAETESDETENVAEEVTDEASGEEKNEENESVSVDENAENQQSAERTTEQPVRNATQSATVPATTNSTAVTPQPSGQETVPAESAQPQQPTVEESVVQSSEPVQNNTPPTTGNKETPFVSN